MKGLAILWIVYFHCTIAYGTRFPWPVSAGNFWDVVSQCAPGSLPGKLACAVEAAVVAVLQRGSYGVGVFLLLSGFGLTYSLVKRPDRQPRWGQWYRRRLARLFPVYWVAHLIVVASPIKYKPDPIDWRFPLSLLGNRVYPVREMFFYLAPAWWFFGLLLELYIVFPLFYELMRRLGALKFLALCITATCVSRYAVIFILHADGNWLQGAFFGCRLWEFATGMAFGKLLAEKQAAVSAALFSTAGFAAGVVLMVLGTLTYQPNLLYLFSDGLLATGLSVVMIRVAAPAARIPWLGKALLKTGVYSYGLYLFHQPFVMAAGEKLQPCGTGTFLIAATALTALVAAASMGVEYAVNRGFERLGGA